MTFRATVAAVGRELGVALPDGDDGFRLTFPADVTVDVEHVWGEVHLYAEVAPLPHNPEPSLLRAMLAENYRAAREGRAVLALDKDREEVLLCQVLLAEEADAARIVQGIRGLTEGVPVWRDRLASVDTSSTMQPAAFMGMRV